MLRVSAHSQHPVRRPVPRLGVRLSDDGIDVAVFASHATAVDLCLIDGSETTSDPTAWTERRIRLDGPELGVWWAHVPGVQVGQRYGFREQFCPATPRSSACEYRRRTNTICQKAIARLDRRIAEKRDSSQISQSLRGKPFPSPHPCG